MTNGCCAFCRRPLPSRNGAGRPREFCSVPCRSLNFFVGKVEAWMGDFLAGLTDSDEDRRAAAAVKRRLWAAANLCNVGGKQIGSGETVRVRLRLPVALALEADRRKGGRQETLVGAIRDGLGA